MTEDEAKTKACPLAATFGGSQQLADGPGPHCIGSACMAWRVRYMSAPQREGMLRDQMRLGMTTDAALASVNSADYPDGFCGLAGVPA